MRSKHYIITLFLIFLGLACTELAEAKHEQLPFYVADSVASVIEYCGGDRYYRVMMGFDRLEGSLQEIASEGYLELFTVMMSTAMYKGNVAYTKVWEAQGAYCL